MGHVGGAVVELGVRQRPAAPVRVALALVERDAQHPLQQRRQPLAGAEAHEARDDLGVEQVLRARAEREPQQRQVGGRGVHHRLDVRVGDQAGDRPEGGALDRVDQVDALRRGDLGQARDGGVGPLPQELEVDGGAALGAGLGHHRLHPGGVADRRELGQPRYPSRPCKRFRSARPSGHVTCCPTSPSALSPASAWPSSGATARARRRCSGSSPAARPGRRLRQHAARRDRGPPRPAAAARQGPDAGAVRRRGHGAGPPGRGRPGRPGGPHGRRRPRRRGDGGVRGGAGATRAGRRLRLARLDGARAARSRHRRGGAPAAARGLLGRRAHARVAGALAGVAARRAAAGRAHEPPRHRGGRVAGAHDRGDRRRRGPRLPRPLVPGVGGDRRAGARPWPVEALADGLLGVPA